MLPSLVDQIQKQYGWYHPEEQAEELFLKRFIEEQGRNFINAARAWDAAAQLMPQPSPRPVLPPLLAEAIGIYNGLTHASPNVPAEVEATLLRLSLQQRTDERDYGFEAEGQLRAEIVRLRAANEALLVEIDELEKEAYDCYEANQPENRLN